MSAVMLNICDCKPNIDILEKIPFERLMKIASHTMCNLPLLHRQPIFGQIFYQCPTGIFMNLFNNTKI